MRGRYADPDAGGVVLDANPEACRLLGQTREEVLETGLDGVFDASDPRLASAVGERRAKGSFRGELRLLRGSGPSLTVEASLAGCRDEECVCMLFWSPGRLEENAEPGEDEWELESVERRFRITFDRAAVGMAHVAPNGRWLRINDKLCEIAGYGREELLEKTFQDITHPEDLDADLEKARWLLEGEIDSYSMDKRYIRKDGFRIWINLNVSLIRRPMGEPDCFIAVIEDITGRKLAELVPDPLTTQEMEVLGLLALGHTHHEIAEGMRYSVSTIKRHVARIIDKLEVENRRQAATRAVEIGLIPPHLTRIP